MADGRAKVKIQSEIGVEEAYFKEQEQKLIKELREKSAKDKNEIYCEEHKDHCFRCGTKSLVEVDRGDINIDICVNENCGKIAAINHPFHILAIASALLKTTIAIARISYYAIYIRCQLYDKSIAAWQ